MAEPEPALTPFEAESSTSSSLLKPLLRVPSASSSRNSTPADSRITSPVPGLPIGAPGIATPASVLAAGSTNPQALEFVRPNIIRSARGSWRSGMARSQTTENQSALDREQYEGLRIIRDFLKIRTSYDVLPISYRLIVLDTSLLVKSSLNVMAQNGIVSAPLWDSKTSTFAGLITAQDYINVVQYYWQNPHALAEIDQFKLTSLPEIEKAIGAQPVETISIHPDRPLYEACRRMLESRARRIPLVDVDDETQRPMVVSVITQYRILKFIAVNVPLTSMLKKPIRDLNIGTYDKLCTAFMNTPVIDCIHMLVQHNISSVPIVDKNGVLLNIFEAVDVINIIKGGEYDGLQITVGAALLKRPDDFSGVHTCSPNDRLDAIFDTVRRSRVHRFIIVDSAGKLKGVLTLSDILDYVLLEGEADEER